MIGQLLKVAYEVVAVGFIVLVILTVRKARARAVCSLTNRRPVFGRFTRTTPTSTNRTRYDRVQG